MALRAERLLNAPRLTAPTTPGHEPDLLSVAANSLSAHLAVLDETGVILAVNDAWRRFAVTEGGESDYLGANYLAVCDRACDPIARRVAAGIRDVASGRANEFECEYPCHSRLQERWFVMRATRSALDSGGHVVVAHEEVTERRRLQDSAQLQSLLLDEVNVAVHTSNLDRTITSWNTGAEQLFGWSANEAIGRRSDELFITSQTPVAPEIRKQIGEGPWEGDVRLSRKDGSAFPAHVRSRVVHDLPEHEPMIVVVSLDISERLRSERELRLARDHLRAVTDSLGEGMLTVDGAGRVLYMNPVAEAHLGWTAAELYGRALHRVTHRGADGSPMPAEACAITRACRARATVKVDDDVFMRADGTELEVAYTAAPFATGEELEGCVIVFRDVGARNASRRRAERQAEKLASIKRIRAALDADRFVLFAQPIIQIESGETVQQELLIRMQDPDAPGAVILPGAFLPVAEEFGLIDEIDRWVIDRAAELAASGAAVELNLSGVSIGDLRLMRHIAAAIGRFGADPGLMVFEITETALIENQLAGSQLVGGLHQLGCRVALDDFGTGYGGFTYLKKLPVDIVKIDTEFVADLTGNAASRNVVQAIVNLARRFQVLTVAEGVEDQETLELLREFGVDQAQGYHIGRPAPIKTTDKRPPERLRNER